MSFTAPASVNMRCTRQSPIPTCRRWTCGKGDCTVLVEFIFVVGTACTHRSHQHDPVPIITHIGYKLLLTTPTNNLYYRKFHATQEYIHVVSLSAFMMCTLHSFHTHDHRAYHPAEQWRQLPPGSESAGAQTPGAHLPRLASTRQPGCQCLLSQGRAGLC